MSGQLPSTLRARADDLAPWDLDVESIVRAGNRRLRRRRLVVVSGGLAACVAVLGGLAALALRPAPASPEPAAGMTRSLTYAVGGVIHTGSGTVDVGHRVVQLVQTMRGFVFTTPDLQVFEEYDGHVQALGRVADVNTPLAVSDDGLVTAWWSGQRIESSPGIRDTGAAVVPDYGRIQTFDVARTWPATTPPRVEALSDGHLWYWDGRRHLITEVDPISDTAVWYDTNRPGSGTVVDAAGDQVLVRLAGGMAVAKANLLPWPGPTNGWRPGGDLNGLTPRVRNVSTGDLAPDGRHWFTADGDGRDAFVVYDVATGNAQTPSYQGGHVTPYAWLGDDTVAAWTIPSGRPHGSVDLLTCRVSTNTCVVADPHVGSLNRLALGGATHR